MIVKISQYCDWKIPFLDVKLYECPFKSIEAELSKLPTANKETLKVLLQHLQKVQESSDKNKMDAKNLATVFGPCVTWRPIVDPNELVNDLMNQKSLAEMLINHCKSIYDN